jgi:hypothetical protein
MAFSGLEKLIDGGCSPFFITSAVSSAIFGEMNRHKQLETIEETLEFKKQIDTNKREFEDEKFNTELAFKREMLELGRYYQAVETEVVNKNRKQRIEFQYFITNCWPIDLDVFTVLKWNRENMIDHKGIAPLRVILSRPNQDTGKLNSDDYKNMCHSLLTNSKELNNIHVLEYSWKEAQNNIGGLAQSMNIHYIMQGIPTLIIIPQLIENTLYFEASMWSFGKGLGSFSHRSLFSMSYNKTDYNEELKEKIKTVQFSIMGVVRDAYMMMEFHRPAALPSCMDKIQRYPDVQSFVLNEYSSMLKQIKSEKRLQNLCSENELKTMENSLYPVTQLLTSNKQ